MAIINLKKKKAPLIPQNNYDTSKKVVDLSPMISKAVAITSIIVIIGNISMDLLFDNVINYPPILFSLILLFWCLPLTNK